MCMAPRGGNIDGNLLARVIESVRVQRGRANGQVKSLSLK
ncbi:MAG: hypothetical protein KatS3mg052_2338 [Candidatus Roseilinea sp.]|nr:MAG: hypothetical protein KatS3mg052_2338 [Candidatus Roseilinea sp.]